MSNTINPFNPSGSNIPQRPIQQASGEEESLHIEPAKTDAARQRSASNTESQSASGKDLNTATEETGANRFGTTLDGALETRDIHAPEAGRAAKQPPTLEGLSAEEQNMIYRYFPESPSLELRLYKSDLSTNKVDPGSVGSRVDLRG